MGWRWLSRAGDTPSHPPNPQYVRIYGVSYVKSAANLRPTIVSCALCVLGILIVAGADGEIAVRGRKRSAQPARDQQGVAGLAIEHTHTSLITIHRKLPTYRSRVEPSGTQFPESRRRRFGCRTRNFLATRKAMAEKRRV